MRRKVSGVLFGNSLDCISLNLFIFIFNSTKWNTQLTFVCTDIHCQLAMAEHERKNGNEANVASFCRTIARDAADERPFENKCAIEINWFEWIDRCIYLVNRLPNRMQKKTKHKWLRIWLTLPRSRLFRRSMSVVSEMPPWTTNTRLLTIVPNGSHRYISSISFSSRSELCCTKRKKTPPY